MSNRRALSCALVMGVAVAPISIAAAQQAESPFAGDVEQPLVAEELAWPEPEYSEPDASVTDASAATMETQGRSMMASGVADSIVALLPPEIGLQQDEASASLIGQNADAPAVAPLAGEVIDAEQARELEEEIDREQAEAMRAETAPGLPRKWVLHYPVSYRDIPVAHYADVAAFVSVEGDVQHLRTRNLPESVDATEPEVEPAEAIETAVDDAGAWAEEAEISEPQLEVWVNPDQTGELSYRIEITSPDLTNPQARRYWIAAVGEPEVLFWESLVRHQHTGQVTGTIWTESGLAGAPTGNQEIEAITVNRSNPPGGSVTTGPNGLYAFPSGGGSATMSATLSGPFSVVDNTAGSEMTRSTAGTPSAPVDLVFNASGDEELAQTSSFYWVNKAQDLAADILAPGDLPNLPTNVNIAGQCNAFWNGSSVNFFRAGGGCPNMAFSDVVYHEVGHGVDARKGGIVNGGYSEGFGDAMAILGTRQSCVGRDFFGAGTCLREASDLIMWPPAPGEGVHAQGRRYAGFVNELVAQLANSYSEDAAYAIATQLVMAAAEANPSDIPDAVLLSFLADDDDGSLANGTPHFAELAAAADSRNLPRPADPTEGVRRMGFAWAHDPAAANYTPSSTYAHNSAGGAISAQRSGTGQYAVTFSGLGGQGRPGGNVQVNAYGSTSDACKVVSWSSSQADFRANVRCFDSSGALKDSRYTILVTWP